MLRGDLDGGDIKPVELEGALRLCRRRRALLLVDPPGGTRTVAAALAFAGTLPRDAYFVKCDGALADGEGGVLNIEIGFAPLKPAEFVVIRLQQIAGASDADR